jgi:hypothetical protein
MASSQGTAPPTDPQLPDLDTQPISILLIDRPTVTLQVAGDHGPLRLTGTLEQAPASLGRVVDATGESHAAVWSDISSFTRVLEPVEGLPAGSFSVGLISDAGRAFQIRAGGAGGGVGASGGAYGGGGLTGSGDSAQGWRLLRMPSGTVSLSGPPFVRIDVPLGKVAAYQRVPLVGEVTGLPRGVIEVEVLGGRTLSLPLENTVLFRRDLGRGMISVSQLDGQSFVGKLVRLPGVSIEVSNDAGKQTVALSRVLQMNRTPPGGIGLAR